MKKLLFLFAALLLGAAAGAQGSVAKKEMRSLLTFHAGPSFPVGDFSSTNFDNEHAGFAKTGLTLNLNYTYQFQKIAGVTGAVFYNRNNTKKTILLAVEEGPDVVLHLDHWQFYGISAGPMLSFELAPELFTDLRVMGGIANANSPEITYEGMVMAKEDWSIAPVIQGGLNLRYNAGNRFFVYTGVDYLYLKPTFNYVYADITEFPSQEIKQKISLLNVSAGVGIRF
ncbi:MAG: hypothetical protein J0L56_06235 [Chitinophagales bacterium]|nr:hypothetical protein [Chitinophagales bacterium]